MCKLKHLKAAMMSVLLGFAICSLMSSCTKTLQGPFYGNWMRPFSPPGSGAQDTAYLKFTANDNFQLWIENYQQGTGYVTTEIGGGSYFYGDSVVSFYFTASNNNTPYCAGYTASYTYHISNSMVLNVYSDTCDASSNEPRSQIMSGTWAKQ